MNINGHQTEPIVDSLRMKGRLRDASDKRGKIARMIHAGQLLRLRRGLCTQRGAISTPIASPRASTALHISASKQHSLSTGLFHGLNRFSEDLDFSLGSPEDEARLESVLTSLELELAAWGFSFHAEPRAVGVQTGVESAFLKGNTRINLLKIGVPEELSRHIPPHQKIAIKLELDTTPPPFAGTEVKTHLLPTPFQVRLYDLPSLFAGKLHALLFRDWKSRVKGRDFYDFVWFVSRRVPVNLPHLEARIRQSGNPAIERLDLAVLQSLLSERFGKVDLAAAADEVRPYLRDARELALWSEAFFKELVSRLTASAGQSGRM